MRHDLSAIVAVCDDWGIGLDGGMIVSNREDMRHFVALTSGCTVLMGRKTLDSFPGGKPLENRRNVVLTRDPEFAREGVDTVRSLEEALEAVEGDEQVWVIGGDSVYHALLPYCSRAVVTKNHCVRPADSFFPNLDADPAWEIAGKMGEDVTPDGVAFEFLDYARVPAPGPAAAPDDFR